MEESASTRLHGGCSSSGDDKSAQLQTVTSSTSHACEGCSLCAMCLACMVSVRQWGAPHRSRWPACGNGQSVFQSEESGMVRLQMLLATMAIRRSRPTSTMSETWVLAGEVVFESREGIRLDVVLATVVRSRNSVSTVGDKESGSSSAVVQSIEKHSRGRLGIQISNEVL